MSIERVSSNFIVMSPGPFDVHMHPRATDPLTNDNFIEINGGVEGKAGLGEYTRAALYSGFTGGIAMPNEIMRKYDPALPDKTYTVPFPISNIDRVHAMQSAIHDRAVIPMGVFVGIDPEEIFDETRQRIDLQAAERNFEAVKDDVMGLKLWGAVSTGGFNIPIHAIPRLATRWYEHNPEKPIILHVEDEGVGQALSDIARLPDGKEIPIHIAHVSSREEMEAVIAAKKDGMNVSCEVTIHHMFLNSSVRTQIGGYGCMKPSLKPQDDVDFLWANLDYIDIIASDCAPHRVSDKEADNPAFGVTNHTVMLPLMLGAVDEGRVSLDEVYRKMCTAPRERFNIPEDDSETHIKLAPTSVHWVDHRVGPRYGHNPFKKIEVVAPLVGHIIQVKAGKSDTRFAEDTSYSHAMTPRSVRGGK